MQQRSSYLSHVSNHSACQRYCLSKGACGLKAGERAAPPSASALSGVTSACWIPGSRRLPERPGPRYRRSQASWREGEASLLQVQLPQRGRDEEAGFCWILTKATDAICIFFAPVRSALELGGLQKHTPTGKTSRPPTLEVSSVTQLLIPTAKPTEAWGGPQGTSWAAHWASGH